MMNETEERIMGVFFKGLLLFGGYILYLYYTFVDVSPGMFIILIISFILAARTTKPSTLNYSDFVKRETFNSIDKNRFNLLLQGLGNYSNQTPKDLIDKARKHMTSKLEQKSSIKIVKQANEVFHEHTDYQIDLFNIIKQSFLRSFTRMMFFGVFMGFFLLITNYPEYYSRNLVLSRYLFYVILFVIGETLLSFFLIVGEIRIRLRAVNIGYDNADRQLEKIKEKVEDKEKEIQDLEARRAQREKAKQKILDILIKDAKNNPFLQTKEF